MNVNIYLKITAISFVTFLTVLVFSGAATQKLSLRLHRVVELIKLNSMYCMCAAGRNDNNNCIYVKSALLLDLPSYTQAPTKNPHL